MIATLLLPLLANPTLAEDRLRIETYNVGLAHGFVDHAPERAGPIWEALAGSEVDVLCLQEAWSDADRRAGVAATTSALPHTWLTQIEPRLSAGAPACGVTDLFGEGKFISCMTGECGDLEGDPKTDCIIDKCGDVLDQLRTQEPDCAQALMAQVGKSTLEAMWAILSPFSPAEIYAYGGSDGLMMLSRLPLEGTGVLDFTDIATLNRRRAIHADVNVGETTVRLFCTHLTADLDGTAPYPGPFESWNEENRSQMTRLLETAGEFDGPTVIMGDINCSLADEAKGIHAESAESCQMAIDAGYADPSTDLGECTYCASNTLTGAEDPDVILDHIYVRGWTVSEATRTRADTVTIGSLTTHLSDHFGIAATIAPAPAEPAPDEEP